MSVSRVPQSVERTKELARVGGRLWWGLLPGAGLTVLGVIQLIHGSRRSAWFWLFLAALALAVVFIAVAYQALAERDHAREAISPAPAPVYNLRSGDAFGDGGTGGVAAGPHAYAEGGQGARPVITAFNVLARASIEMGYTLDEFLAEAGFRPDDPGLELVGAGGAGGGSSVGLGPERGQDGGSGICVVTCCGDDEKPIKVDVFRIDWHYEIWPKGSGRATVKASMTPSPPAASPKSNTRK